MSRVKLGMLLCMFFGLMMIVIGCCSSDYDSNYDQGGGNDAVAIRAQIQYWQDGVPTTTTPIRFITSADPNPPPTYIIQGRTFRIIAQKITVKDGREVATEINPITCISEVNWGNFPENKVVKWFDKDQGWFYHLDEQFPKQFFCARLKICNCDFAFPFTPICADQIP